MNIVSEPRYLQIAVNGVSFGHVHGILTYSIPAGWSSDLDPGTLVWVPIQKRVELGIVIGDAAELPDLEVRALHAQVNPPIRLNQVQMSTAFWMARETVSSLYACAALFLPPGILHRRREVYALAPDPVIDVIKLTATQQKVVNHLRENGRTTLDALRYATGQKLDSVLARLVESGVISRDLEVDQRIPGEPSVQVLRLLNDDVSLTSRSAKQAAIQNALILRRRLLRDDDSEFATVEALRERVDADSATLRAMAKKGVIELEAVPRSKAPHSRSASPPELTAQQAAVWASIERRLTQQDSTPTLLFGVTGSGKTEIYLRAVAWCLRFNRGAIILLPEIALATQIVRRFVERFPGRVAVLHSQMSDVQRYATWKAIESGEFQVVVGPRSALFAPVVEPGLIVLDEEHEGSFKQDSEPRYHARSVAVYLARLYRASLVLGSATPSVESWHHADQGEWNLAELSERVAPSMADGSLELPPVEIVDLRQELQRSNTSLLSRRLQEVVSMALRRGEQSILLLNRRGQSTVVLCRDCGHRLECPHCDIPLVFHRDRGTLICHRCDYRETPPRFCPDCQGRLDFFGSGTQRVEEEVGAMFPDAKVMRWDQDSVRQLGGYTAMLERVEQGLVDIVIGTQMVAKGFDLPKVTVVGVIQADTMLHLPDFRSAERTFQLVTQVAGRAGRRAPGSRVIVQTYTPGHYAIRHASQHDFRAFYEEERAFREHFVYPPYARLVRCVYKHRHEQAAAIEAEMMVRKLARLARSEGVEIDLMGPTPAFAAKVRGMFQWQIVLRGRNLDALLDEFPVGPGWVIDVDPQSML
ncbi:MAG: primosomal protein N' [Thermomicrobiales bacterium]